MTLFKTTLILMVLALFYPIRNLAQEQTVKSSWELDTAKSDFGGIARERAAPRLLTLAINSIKFNLSRTFPALPAESEELLTDGSELIIRKPDFTVARKLSVSKDIQSYTVDSKYHMISSDGGTWDYTRKETYTIAKDKKTLLLIRVSVTPDGTETVRAIYNRR